MDGWLVIGFFMIVVGIPVIGGILADVHRRRLKFREKELELTTARTAELAAQYAASNKALEARLRVLEQIVTDGGYQTAAQIEALREPRQIEGESKQ